MHKCCGIYRSRSVTRLALAIAAGALCLGSVVNADLQLDESSAATDSNDNWKNGWAVPDGFSLAIDTLGYQYPTAIAFVPHPGDDPKDPLYFVTELRGTIKVITNDRTVTTFASGFLQTEFDKELPRGESEFGLAGLCLEPERGYVFVTFTYQDDQNVLRNNVMRFQSTPGTFSLEPTSRLAFTDTFARDESGPSHQIGPCNVHENQLYVSVGDGFVSPLNSQNIDSTLGKILRMRLDGAPVPDNPFYEDADKTRARNYVWAYGLRNPFSQSVVNGHVMVTENGLERDRFLEVRKGRNYLWNGSDESIATNAAYVFLDSMGPVQMDYSATSAFFPDEYADQFFVASSSDSGVTRINYDVQDGMLVSMPEHFVAAAEGERTDPVLGLAFGPDGLYFSPMLPVKDNQGAVLKVQYDPDKAHDFTLAELADPVALAEDGKDLMRENGCFGCHRLAGKFELGGTNGPVLNRGSGPMFDRITARINSADYLQSLRALDARDEEPFNRYKDARAALVRAQGRERIKIWLTYHILEPRFDKPYSTMPNMGLNEVEAEAIARYLLGEDDGGGLSQSIKNMLPEPRYRHFAYAFAAGLVIGLPVLVVLWIVGRAWARRRQS